VATPQPVVLPSHYRYILSPIVDYVLEAERTSPNQRCSCTRIGPAAHRIPKG